MEYVKKCWTHTLGEPIREEQLVTVRECLNRQRPFGKTDWQVEMASMFGLGSTLRPRGRPRNEKKSEPVLYSTLFDAGSENHRSGVWTSGEITVLLDMDEEAAWKRQKRIYERA
jgi:hypothetical protein